MDGRKPEVESRRLWRHQEDQSPINRHMETRPGAVQQVMLLSVSTHL